MKKRTYGTGSFRKVDAGRYELRYRGKHRRIEAATDKQADRALHDWVKAVEHAEKAGPAVSMDQLFELHLADLRRMKRESVKVTEQRLNKNVRPVLGKLDAAKVSKGDIDAYIDRRMASGAGNATINRELAIIRRSFKIGIEDGLDIKLPMIKTLPEDNARQGFVEEDVYRAFLMELPAHAQMAWVFSYFTGMRKKELSKLLWEWVDWTRWVIEVPSRITKNKKTRIIPVYSDMRDFLKIAYQARNPACPYLFQRDGAQMVSFRTAFEGARRRLNLPAVLFHDLRRTAVRNMDREGIHRTIARQVSGHRTESVYIRYSIGSEKDALEVGERMAAFHERERAKARAAEELWVKLWGPETEPERDNDQQNPAKLKN